MIVTEFNPKHGYCSVAIESSEDLWTLRRLIRRGDVVVARSSRVVKREEEFARPDRGDRVSVTVALAVEEIHLDNSIERVRVRGSIVESTDESITKSGSHSITLSPGHLATIRKKRWSALDTRLLEAGKSEGTRFLLVAMDRREAGIGSLSGTHLSVLASIESGLGGKMSDEPSPKPYMSKVASLVSEAARDGDTVVIAGPGHTKSVMMNQLGAESKGRYRLQPLDGFDLTGSDGVRALVRFPAFQELAKGSVLVRMCALVGEAIRRISAGDPKVAYTLSRVKEAAAAGAVEAAVVSDDVFSSGVDEYELVETLNSIEERRGTVYLADSSLEFGKQVSAFGGIVALLRYRLRAY
ncbi:MAG: hypothetical protein LYZ70_02045 [Nitrososphaerales archaeon]|nr:hypothetical protein [Nitrososphaerales archaeon]